jgi:hypothetical protein
MSQNFNGHSCSYYSTSPVYNNDKGIRVTGDVKVLGGGGIGNYDWSGNTVLTSIFMVGPSNATIQGKADSDPNWGALPSVIIDKDSDAQTVSLIGRIPIIGRFERKINRGTIIPGSSTVVSSNNVMLGFDGLLDLNGADLFNLDMNTGRWNNYLFVLSDVHVRGNLNFPDLINFGYEGTYLSDCGSVYAYGDVISGVNMTGFESNLSNHLTACAKPPTDPGSGAVRW